jgi:hypothetical protein
VPVAAQRHRPIWSKRWSSCSWFRMYARITLHDVGLWIGVDKKCWLHPVQRNSKNLNSPPFSSADPLTLFVFDSPTLDRLKGAPCFTLQMLHFADWYRLFTTAQ